jgi:hypothetical protein
MLLAEDLLLLVTDDVSGRLSVPAAQVDAGLGGANIPGRPHEQTPQRTHGDTAGHCPARALHPPPEGIPAPSRYFVIGGNVALPAQAHTQVRPYAW